MSTHVRGERLRPRVPVEAGADERAVLVPRVARVGRGVDRQHRQVAGADAVDDLGLLLRAPRRLADREQRERPRRRATRPRRARARRRPAAAASPWSSATCATPTAAWSSTPCTPAGPVAVRRDLGDEEQAVRHRVCQPRRAPSSGRRPRCVLVDVDQRPHLEAGLGEHRGEGGGVHVEVRVVLVARCWRRRRTCRGGSRARRRRPGSVSTTSSAARSRRCAARGALRVRGAHDVGVAVVQDVPRQDVIDAARRRAGAR